MNEAKILYSHLCEEAAQVLNKVLKSVIDNKIKALVREAQTDAPYDVQVASRERAAQDVQRCESIIEIKCVLERLLDDSGEAVA